MTARESCYVSHDSQNHRIIIGNEWIERAFDYNPRKNTFYTSHLFTKSDKKNWAVREHREFSLAVQTQNNIVTITNSLENDRGGLHFENCQTASIGNGGKILTVTLSSTLMPLRIRLYHEIHPDGTWIRRWMGLENNANAPLTVHDYNPEYITPPTGIKGYYFNSWRWGSRAYVENARAYAGIGIHSIQARNRLVTPPAVPTDSPLVVTDNSCRNFLWFFPEVPIKSVIFREDPHTLVTTDNPWGVVIEPGRSVDFSAGIVIGIGSGSFRDGFHDFRTYLENRVRKIPNPPKKSPLVFNSWYGLGYSKDQPCETDCRKQIDLCSELGVEMYVLDAGWHNHVGDWQADPNKFPKGLKAIAQYCKNKGLKFGLWIDSRIADSQSRLYHDHPEWSVKKKDGSLYRDNFLGHDIIGMCLASDFGDDLKNNYVQLVTDLELDCLKIDNVCLLDFYRFWSQCHDPDHHHLPGASHKAVWEKWIEILDAVRKARPDIIIESIPSGLSLLDKFDVVWSADYQYRPDWRKEADFYRALLYHMAYTHPVTAIHQGWPSTDCTDLADLDYLCASTIGSAIHCGFTGNIESVDDVQKAVLKKWILWRNQNLKYLSVYQHLFEDRPPLPIETVEDDIYMDALAKHYTPSDIDGFAHLLPDGGWIFLFNPTDSTQSVRFTLNLSRFGIDAFSAVTEMNAFSYNPQKNDLTLQQTLRPGSYSKSRILTGAPVCVNRIENAITDFQWNPSRKTLQFKIRQTSGTPLVLLSTGPLGQPCRIEFGNITAYDPPSNTLELSLALPAGMDQGPMSPPVTCQWE